MYESRQRNVKFFFASTFTEMSQLYGVVFKSKPHIN